MQISKLYETKLECSSYNVTIDSTDTTVTLTLVDFNGSPVTNTAVTLKADKGYFTKAVGKTTTTYTDASATKTINATTDNNGKVVATWTASEWGLCTFSANNINSQIIVKGWRKIYNSNNTTAWINDECFRVGVADYSLNLAKNTRYTNKITVTGLSPDIYYYSNTGSSVIEARLTPEGKIQFRNNHASNDYSNTISTTFFGKLND